MRKLITIGIILFLIQGIANAKMGVGVGTGKIVIDQDLKPGTIYQLPPLSVINTGDESSDYEVSISHLEKQPQLIPEKEWFIFTPQKFHLDPGKVQVVDMKINLPITVIPGDYFVYLTGQPVQKSTQGETTIGIAAAAKLYFKVLPANIFTGIYYKIISFWNVYAPWPQRVVMVLGLCLVYLFARKYLNINIGVKKIQKEKSNVKNVEDEHKQDKENE